MMEGGKEIPPACYKRSVIRVCTINVGEERGGFAVKTSHSGHGLAVQYYLFYSLAELVRRTICGSDVCSSAVCSSTT